MIGISLFFFGERIGSSKDIKFTNENESDNDHKKDINKK
jgi:hypothetical protein